MTKSTSSSGKSTPSSSAKGKVSKRKRGWADFRSGDSSAVELGPQAQVTKEAEPRPSRRSDGTLHFGTAYDDFRPNLTPIQVLAEGAFGGCYYRPIVSLGREELAGCWADDFAAGDLDSIDVDRLVAAPAYDQSVNKFGAKCGGSLAMWESKGWISPLDPYGWFQWYVRFYYGRRSTDDRRQISRWSRLAGPKGRWKNNLLGRLRNGKDSAAMRQILHHWALDIDRDIEEHHPDIDTSAKDDRTAE